MARGGARAGAGRKAGVPKLMTLEAIAEARETGELPAHYMLRVMRDPKAEDRRRDAMAQAAAPYFHSRLASIEHTGKDGEPLIPVTDADRARALAAFLARVKSEKS